MNALAYKFKKYGSCLITLLIVLFSLLFGCATTAVPSGPDDLDTALREASGYLNLNLPKGSKVAIINIQSDHSNLSEYIIEELIANAVNDKVFSVVDRAQLESIRMELDFQLSGEVSDESARSIGKFLGAETIVTGAISELADRHRLRLRALNVETAQVQGQYNRNINASPLIAALMKGGRTGTASYAVRTGTARTGGTTAINSTQGSAGVSADVSAGNMANTNTIERQITPQTSPPQAATPVYRIGDTGPAGGLIFYDKGNRTGGWRYLEAAPANAEKRAKLLVKYVAMTHGPEADRMDVKQTSEEPGRGRENTEYLISRLTYLGFWDTAAQYCNDLVFNGFDDWYLPSIKELSFIYGNLVRKEMGNFREFLYWSSTGWNSGSGWQTGYGGLTWNMQTGLSVGKGENAIVEEHYVRPVRRF